MSLIPKKQAKKQYPPFEELTQIIYGEPKAGKTTFMGSAPNTFFCATEPGQDFTDAPAQLITCWAPVAVEDEEGNVIVRPDTVSNFQDLVRELYGQKQKGSLEYRTCVIDIVDNLWGMCMTHICQAKGIEYPPESDYGKTWKECRTEWETWLRRLMGIMEVSFITHCTNDKKEIKLENGMTKEVTRFIPTFKGNKAAQFLDGVVNCMGYIYTDQKGKRKITYKSDITLGTGDRTNLLEQLGEMDLDYKAVSAAYASKANELGIELVSKYPNQKGK